jgi:hypothetical protein
MKPRTELQRLRAVRQQASKDLKAIVARREQEQSEKERAQLDAERANRTQEQAQ